MVHCPTSNSKLAAGVCRVRDLLARGVNVGLGTDSASSNNSLDMFAEMKLSCLLAKVRAAPVLSVYVCLYVCVCVRASACIHTHTCATYLRQVTTGDASAVPAAAALTMATLGGARALGLGAVTGSLLPGKAADFITLDLSSVEARPLYDVVGHIVYACGREHVRDVWVGGRPLMRGRALRTIDEAGVLADADAWRARIAGVRGSDGAPMHAL